MHRVTCIQRIFLKMKLLFVLLIFLTVRNVYSIKKLNIGIFIEADCIYSKQFITNQFRPAYRGIKDRVEVDFFTFGKSESFIGVDGEVKFRCQHGKEECRKNKLQTCGLHMLSKKDLQGLKSKTFFEFFFIFFIVFQRISFHVPWDFPSHTWSVLISSI